MVKLNPKQPITSAKQIEDLQYALARERHARLDTERRLLKLTSELGFKSARLNDFVKNFNALVEEKSAELHATHRAAMDAVNAKNQFISNITHELRTPLNGVIGIFNLLQDVQSLSQDDRELVMIGAQSAEHLMKIINQILDFSKYESTSKRAEASVINLYDTINPICKAEQKAFDDKGIIFESVFSFSATDHIEFDATSLRQLVDNLLDNARKFTLSGGRVSLQIALQACNQEDWEDRDGQIDGSSLDHAAQDSAQTVKKIDGERQTLLITVTDTGIGMSAAQQRLIFNAYVQAESDITRRFGGTGLGLYIVKTIVDSCGGEVVVLSELEEGSTFTVRLPVIFRHKSNSVATSNSEQFGTVDAFDGLRVLVVEDNETNQLIARKTLEKWAVMVDVASNGKEAVALAQDQLFDLILMDIEMPKMNGFETTKAIKQSGGVSASVSVVAMTAHCSKEHIDACLDVGMVAHLPKPFTLQQLASTLAEYTGIKGSRKAENESDQQLPLNTSNKNIYEISDEMVKHNESTVPVGSIVQSFESVEEYKDTMKLTEAEQQTLDAALERLDGDRVLLCRLASGMISESVDYTQALLQRMPLTDMDWQDTARKYHTLKGTSGNLGFDQIYQLAAALEVFVQERQLDKIVYCAQRLMTELQHAERLVDTLKLRSVIDTPDSVRYYDADVLKNKLLQVQALVATDVGQVDDIITELSQGAVCELGEPYVEQLQSAMMQFDIKAIESICKDAVAALTIQES